jgi:hypothetical protein
MGIFEDVKVEVSLHAEKRLKYATEQIVTKENFLGLEV